MLHVQLSQQVLDTFLSLSVAVAFSVYIVVHRVAEQKAGFHLCIRDGRWLLCTSSC